MSETQVCEVCKRNLKAEPHDAFDSQCAKDGVWFRNRIIDELRAALSAAEKERDAEHEANNRAAGKVLAVVELASRQDCLNRWGDDPCESPDCLHCRAAELLPELKCRCGKWTLDRARPSLYEKPIYHQPDSCLAPQPPQHCTSCKQVLPHTALIPSEPAALELASAASEAQPPPASSVPVASSTQEGE